MTIAYLILYLAALITQGTPSGATDQGRRCMDTRIGGYAWLTVIDYGTANEDEVDYFENRGAMLDFFVVGDEWPGRSFVAYIETGDLCRYPAAEECMRDVTRITAGFRCTGEER